jgi:hypothetical protein
MTHIVLCQVTAQDLLELIRQTVIVHLQIHYTKPRYTQIGKALTVLHKAPAPVILLEGNLVFCITNLSVINCRHLKYLSLLGDIIYHNNLIKF